jgi:hypothetical protein
LNLDRKTLGKLAHLEFKTIPNPSARDLYEYVGYVLKNGAQDAGRLRGVAVILKRYFEAKAATDPSISVWRGLWKGGTKA